jgi:hypothetical protein
MATLALSAHAEDSPFSVSISQALARDSNIMRTLPELQIHDDISSTVLSASLNEKLGRQHLRLDASLDAERFRHTTDLNNNAPTFKGELDWETLYHLEGELGASHARELYRYDLDGTGLSLDRNIQTTNQAYFRVRKGVVTPLTLEAGWNAYQRLYTSDAYASDEMRRQAWNAGVRFQPDTDLSLRGLVRYTQGSYPHYSETLGADHYTRWDVESQLAWQITGASHIDARIAHSNEDRQLQTSRGRWTGSAGWTWQPTGKLTFDTRLTRDNDTGEQALGDGLTGSDVKLATTLSLTARWQATSKVMFSLSGEHTRRQLGQEETATYDLRGTDRSRSVTLGVSYQALRGLLLGCTAHREVRDVSGDSSLSYPYSANVYSCYGQLTFD